jgi:preprotein translocase subunit SecG
MSRRVMVIVVVVVAALVLIGVVLYGLDTGGSGGGDPGPVSGY